MRTYQHNPAAKFNSGRMIRHIAALAVAVLTNHSFAEDWGAYSIVPFSAQAMVLEVDRLNAELSVDGLPTIAIGIGLDTGEVVAGHVGSDKRLEFTLIGVPVNNSAYLSKVRPPRVLMSEATRDALQNKVSVVDYEPMLLKGASQKQPIFQLEILEVTTES